MVPSHFRHHGAIQHAAKLHDGRVWRADHRGHCASWSCGRWGGSLFLGLGIRTPEERSADLDLTVTRCDAARGKTQVLGRKGKCEKEVMWKELVIRIDFWKLKPPKIEGIHLPRPQLFSSSVLFFPLGEAGKGKDLDHVTQPLSHMVGGPQEHGAQRPAADLIFISGQRSKFEHPALLANPPVP